MEIKNMWKKFLLILTTDSIQLEFPEIPTPLLKLLQAPEAGFVASNNNLWWERPLEEEWVKKTSSLVRKFASDGARIEDFRVSSPQTETKPIPDPLSPECIDELNRHNLYRQLAQLQEEIKELKKFDAIALERLTLLKQQLEGDQKPKARTRSTSKGGGRTKSSS